nr:MAG TPA: hypothetical protein [Caudoviricetes sp.]
MNPLWLLLIIPSSELIGFFVAAMCFQAKEH